MSIQLSTSDASIITAITRLTLVPLEKRLEFLSEAIDPRTIELGRYMLGLEPNPDPEIKRLGDKIAGWNKEVKEQALRTRRSRKRTSVD